MNVHLGVRPLFYDALSGDFLPPSDKQGRKHTLGRLTVAAATKGVSYPYSYMEGLSVPRSLSDHPIRTYTYSPSWAPIEVIVAQETRGAGFLMGLQIQSANSSGGLAVYDRTTEAGNSLRLVHNDAVQELETDLGEGLPSTQLVVAKVAQQFFDRILAS